MCPPPPESAKVRRMPSWEMGNIGEIEISARARSALLKSVLPRRVVRYREIRRLTQSRLAALARMSPSTLNVIESGLAGDVLLSTIERICEVLEIGPDALIVDARVSESCRRCGRLFQAGNLHTVGDCIFLLEQDGRSEAWIAAACGLPATVIGSILTAEYEVHRLRRNPAPIGVVKSGGSTDGK